MSSIKSFDDSLDWISFYKNSKIMCWDNENQVEEFSKKELKKLFLKGIKEPKQILK